MANIGSLVLTKAASGTENYYDFGASTPYVSYGIPENYIIIDADPAAAAFIGFTNVDMDTEGEGFSDILAGDVAGEWYPLSNAVDYPSIKVPISAGTWRYFYVCSSAGTADVKIKIGVSDPNNARTTVQTMTAAT